MGGCLLAEGAAKALEVDVNMKEVCQHSELRTYAHVQGEELDASCARGDGSHHLCPFRSPGPCCMLHVVAMSP